MAVTQSPPKVIVINDYGSASAVGRTRITGSSTKTRVTLQIQSEPVGVLIDPKALGGVVADAIANAIANQIRAINATVSEGTVLKRKYALSALLRGARWATQRYSGGRSGDSMPDSQGGDRLFNDSGRLADGIVARASSGGEYTINVTANRLDPTTFGPVAFLTMITSLFSLVPALMNPAKLADDPGVSSAIAETLNTMVAKGSGILSLESKSLLKRARSALISGVKLLGNTMSHEDRNAKDEG